MYPCTLFSTMPETSPTSVELLTNRLSHLWEGINTTRWHQCPNFNKAGIYLNNTEKEHTPPAQTQEEIKNSLYTFVVSVFLKQRSTEHKHSMQLIWIST